MEKDLAYYRRRMTEEQRRASSATCGATRITHESLAAMYTAKIDSLARDGGTVARSPG